MTKIQEKIMQMMDEINEICKNESLHYILTHATAEYVKANNIFVNSVCEFQLLMPLSDILILFKNAQKLYGKIRAFESWENNSALHQMTFRYVDKESLLIERERGEYHSKPGVAITIYAAKAQKPSHEEIGGERYLQMYNQGADKLFWIPFWIKLSIKRMTKKLFGKEYAKKVIKIKDFNIDMANTGGVALGGFKAMCMGKNKLAESLIHSQNKEREDASSKKYWFMQNNLRLISLPKDLFTNVKQVEFENRNFFVYNKKLVIDSYGAACISNQINVISDANMPYDEYLKYIEGKENTLASLSRSRAEFNFWLKTVWKPAEKRRSDIFSQIKRSVDRINIWHSLRLKREEIRAAYKEKDIDRLRNLLKTYLSTTDKYAKKDIGFYIDDELFECAKLIWEKDHRKKFAEKVYSMVPDLYRNETPDEYFSKR